MTEPVTTPSSRRIGGMTETMPTKNFRIDEETYARAKQRAERESQNISTLIREWVSDYAAGKPRVGPGRPAGVEVSRAELTKLRDLVDRILA